MTLATACVRTWAVALAAAALGGCASLPSPDYRAGLPAGLPSHVEMQTVPFFAQEKYQCGPAALATVLTQAGVQRTPQDLVPQVFLPEREGSLQPEMLAATRRAGLLPYPLAPDLGALLAEVAARHPVLVLQNLRFSWLPQWHYAVVVGYGLDSGELILRSGTERRVIMGIADFDRSWAKAGRWAFVALPPGELPVTVREAEYANAAASLERVSAPAADAAYRAALQRWPKNLVARIGLGNVAYGRHDLAAAEAEYRRATTDHPESGDAWNNLAQVLHELGHDAEALEAAHRAVAVGGARLDVYRSTLAVIEGGIAR